ncbi:hypothetical protein [Bacillus bombysepticus]|uniref:hypothetical protein n=1 Tax=Bacillus bombysepticus TaxID=658666 RepID=UPI00301A82CA
MIVMNINENETSNIEIGPYYDKDGRIVKNVPFFVSTVKYGADSYQSRSISTNVQENIDLLLAYMDRTAKNVVDYNDFLKNPNTYGAINVGGPKDPNNFAFDY